MARQWVSRLGKGNGRRAGFFSWGLGEGRMTRRGVIAGHYGVYNILGLYQIGSRKLSTRIFGPIRLL